MTCSRKMFRNDLAGARGAAVDVPHKKVMLCLNESTLNPYQVLKTKIEEKLKEIPFNRYFNPVTGELKRQLAEYCGLDHDYILFGNGADEMLYYLFTSVREKPGDFALSVSPSYFDYKSYTRAIGLDLRTLDLDLDFDFKTRDYLAIAGSSDCRMAIVCNPNNPTGNLFPPGKIKEIISGCSQIVLVDETYYEFSGKTLADQVDRYRNLVIVRSFSKAFSAAGLRFGYVLSHPDNINQIRKVVTAFNIGVVSQALASVILENRKIFRLHNAKVIKAREKMYGEMEKIRGLTVKDSYTNFLIFSAGKMSPALFDHLKKNEIAVRAIWNHPVLENYLRVTIGTEFENELFLSEVKEFMDREG